VASSLRLDFVGAKFSIDPLVSGMLRWKREALVVATELALRVEPFQG
jgi:hypothetical protein